MRPAEMIEKASRARRAIEDVLVETPHERRPVVKKALRAIEDLTSGLVSASRRDIMSEEHCEWWLLRAKGGNTFASIAELYDRHEETVRRGFYRIDAKLRAGARPVSEKLSAEINAILNA